LAELQCVPTDEHRTLLRLLESGDLTARRTNLGQKEAGQEKKKKSDLSNMGKGLAHRAGRSGARDSGVAGSR
jgi:hypothetical protein